MGFHAPGNNSVHHLHMHIIVLPFKTNNEKKIEYLDHIEFGRDLLIVDEVVSSVREILPEFIKGIKMTTEEKRLNRLENNLRRT